MTEKLVKSTPKSHKTKFFFLRKSLTIKAFRALNKIGGRFLQIAGYQFLRQMAIKNPW
jgi:hypothetical protein